MKKIVNSGIRYFGRKMARHNQKQIKNNQKILILFVNIFLWRFPGRNMRAYILSATPLKSSLECLPHKNKSEEKFVCELRVC